MYFRHHRSRRLVQALASPACSTRKTKHPTHLVFSRRRFRNRAGVSRPYQRLVGPGRSFKEPPGSSYQEIFHLNPADDLSHLEPHRSSARCFFPLARRSFPLRLLLLISADASGHSSHSFLSRPSEQSRSRPIEPSCNVPERFIFRRRVFAVVRAPDSTTLSFYFVDHRRSSRRRRQRSSPGILERRRSRRRKSEGRICYRSSVSRVFLRSFFLEMESDAPLSFPVRATIADDVPASQKLSDDELLGQIVTFVSLTSPISSPLSSLRL